MGHLRILLIGAALFSFVSCMDEMKQATSPQAAITSFSLGYYDVLVHDINVHNRDTVIKERQGGSMYPMTIDQLNNKIFNLDSLAFGSQISGVTSNVNGVGTIIYRYVDEPELNHLWQSSDSIDFTRPLQFCAVASDGSYTRTYDVHINVRTVFPDSLIWNDADTIGFPILTRINSVVKGDTVYCFGLSQDSVPSVTFRHVIYGDWNGSNVMNGLPIDGWQHSVVLQRGKFYTVSDGTLYSSDDALNWSVLKSGVKSVFGSVSDTLLWAVTYDSLIIKSSDTQSWTTVQRCPGLFPDSVAILINKPLATNNKISRSVLINGSVSGDYISMWTMLSTDSVWTQMVLPSKEELRLNSLQNLSVIQYDGSLFATGTNSDSFIQSDDNGLTWRKCASFCYDYSSWNRYMQLPRDLKEGGYAFTCSTDSYGFIWLMTECGKVWNGAINRLNRR